MFKILRRIELQDRRSRLCEIGSMKHDCNKRIVAPATAGCLSFGPTDRPDNAPLLRLSQPLISNPLSEPSNVHAIKIRDK